MSQDKQREVGLPLEAKTHQYLSQPLNNSPRKSPKSFESAAGAQRRENEARALLTIANG
jgi:hypothetical protein